MLPAGSFPYGRRGGGWGGVIRGFFTVSVEIFPKIFIIASPLFSKFLVVFLCRRPKIVCRKISQGDQFPLNHHLETTSLPVNIEVAKLQSLSDRVMEVEITSHGVWKSLSLLFQCTGAGLIVTLFVSLSGGTTSGFGAKIPDLLRI